jgi:hypothetical protein
MLSMFAEIAKTLVLQATILEICGFMPDRKEPAVVSDLFRPCFLLFRIILVIIGTGYFQWYSIPKMICGDTTSQKTPGLG